MQNSFQHVQLIGNAVRGIQHVTTEFMIFYCEHTHVRYDFNHDVMLWL